jgi:hypothetical protein
MSFFFCFKPCRWGVKASQAMLHGKWRGFRCMRGSDALPRRGIGIGHSGGTETWDERRTGGDRAQSHASFDGRIRGGQRLSPPLRFQGLRILHTTKAGRHCPRGSTCQPSLKTLSKNHRRGQKNQFGSSDSDDKTREISPSTHFAASTYLCGTHPQPFYSPVPCIGPRAALARGSEVGASLQSRAARPFAREGTRKRPGLSWVWKERLFRGGA